MEMASIIWINGNSTIFTLYQFKITGFLKKQPLLKPFLPKVDAKYIIFETRNRWEVILSHM